MSNSAKNTPVRRWSDLTAVEFKEMYALISSNAERHLRCANILGAEKEYQNAVAHMILATEERIKAFTCLLISKNPKVKHYTWFKKVFKDHKTRHDLIKDFFSIYLVFNYSAGSGNEGISISSMLIALVKNIGMAAGNFVFWNNAANLKERAFYVDFIDKPVDPVTIVSKDYEMAMRYTSVFFKNMDKIIADIQGMSDEDFNQLLIDTDMDSIDRERDLANSESQNKQR